MDSTKLKKWLRDNSSGIYRPAADAADLIDHLEETVNELTTGERGDNSVNVDTLEEMESIAMDIKKEFALSKLTGKWGYGSRGSEDEIDFIYSSRLEALQEAVAPYRDGRSENPAV